MTRGDGVPEQNTVGVIGLGAMGLPIAGHLARAGLSVTVHDTDATRTRRQPGTAATWRPTRPGSAREAR
jgi:3-hydroxyisobutyrate dehydrogenase-like beta-hydroxyacid dehydrogenase